MKVLFITWDGPQVNYLEGLFLPIFSKLKHRGIDFEVLQFTWANSRRIEEIAKLCNEQGISYKAHKIYRQPKSVGALVTVFLGIYAIRKYIKDQKIDILFPRSILPGVMSIKAVNKMENVQIVFDADGLPYDERVEFYDWESKSLKYRLMRDLEAQVVHQSDRIATRTNRACQILQNRAGAGALLSKFHVVFNGRDEEKFSLKSHSNNQKIKQKFGWKAETPLLLYIGSLGEQYCENEMAEFFISLFKRLNTTRWLILSADNERGDKLINKLGDFKKFAAVDTVSTDEISEYIAAADLGLALRKPSFSMQAVAPVKLGEYLLCGTPVLTTAGIGDSDAIFDDSIGQVLDLDKQNAINHAVQWFIESVLPHRVRFRKACRERGLQHFSLEATVNSYERVLLPDTHK